jgi:diguanylate cyclase (GGDEF)-like protein
VSTDLAAPDHTDGTTGLPRGAAWRARADDLLRDGGRRWVLLLVDLDGFARVNAAHGHLTADHVLARVGAALREVAGPGGVAGRFGGDEFVLLLPRPDGTAPDAAAHSVRRAVAALDVVVDGPAGPVRISGLTASVGAAASGPGLAALLWCADRALYAAKRAGGGVPSAERGSAGGRALHDVPGGPDVVVGDVAVVRAGDAVPDGVAVHGLAGGVALDDDRGARLLDLGDHLARRRRAGADVEPLDAGALAGAQERSGGDDRGDPSDPYCCAARHPTRCPPDG